MEIDTAPILKFYLLNIFFLLFMENETKGRFWVNASWKKLHKESIYHLSSSPYFFNSISSQKLKNSSKGTGLLLELNIA